jgi:amino-acid N-acetyltransferase
MSSPVVRRAVVGDAERILALVNGLAARQLMLPRSPVAVIENIRDYAIADVGGRFAGCGALHVVWSDLAEIRSLAVDPDIQRKGLGRLIVERLVEDAHELGIARLFAFTYVPGFFEKLGFHVVEHASMPHKVFHDCLNCPKFNACDEIAMLRVLREVDEEHERGPLSLPRAGMMPLPRSRAT